MPSIDKTVMTITHEPVSTWHLDLSVKEYRVRQTRPWFRLKRWSRRLWFWLVMRKFYMLDGGLTKGELVHLLDCVPPSDLALDLAVAFNLDLKVIRLLVIRHARVRRETVN